MRNRLNGKYIRDQKFIKKYNGFELKNVNIELPKEMIMGFIGENGAGKTTTIKAILNILNTFLPLIFIGLTIIIYYISYKVAYKIYDKKEI